jgi:Ni/Fe-hydrogenase subunit HybB-like protein
MKNNFIFLLWIIIFIFIFYTSAGSFIVCATRYIKYEML